MMRNPGHVLSRDQLEQRGWDSTFRKKINIKKYESQNKRKHKSIPKGDSKFY